MHTNRRVFLLEVFGDICGKIGYYLEKNRDVSLFSICKNTGMGKRDTIKSLSLLIHFGVVGFTNYSGRGVRYFINSSHGSLNNYPLFLNYVDRVYGASGSQIALEVLIRRQLSIGSISEELLTCAKKMLLDRVIQEESSSGVKRVKEETGGYVTFSANSVSSKILNEMLCNDILKQFTDTTKSVFCALGTFHPAPSPLNKVVERCLELGVQPDRGSTHPETIHKHIKYLVAYGAVSKNHGIYQVNLQVYLDKIKRNFVLEYCELYIAPFSSTVLSMLLNRRYVEDKFVEKHLLLESSECKKILFMLLSERLISMQMIPRTADCSPSRSFHLWSANLHKTIHVVEQKVHKKLNDTYIELKVLQEKKLFITPSEYKHKTDLIFIALERLHLFCFILGL